MLTMLDDEHVEQRPTSISTHNISISGILCSNLFVVRLSDLRIVKPRPTLLILFTLYSLSCDEYSSRPVFLEKRCLSES